MKSALIAPKGMCLTHEQVQHYIKQNQQDEKRGAETGGMSRRSGWRLDGTERNKERQSKRDRVRGLLCLHFH